ncbi:fructose-bisphosphate aldolase [Ureaplasma diversum]|uniref:Fructose-bisphosphate aldolase (Fba) n=2 Tax=Ureaplasma diversum TaxID=42094 RepID=A0A084EZQ8_9BACT|nr:class II fructose-1,6-bisphosphate aldolase [Ureaplasma diversum]AJQ45636.1 fructose-bisphosphate aldolase [Ureaplasma diversum]KEZ23450.1 Fructose-bisphosphate aldolase (Fba) [Ureaplasma diversum NCTC 246]
MLTNAKVMIADAKANQYAIPAININNLEWIKAVLEAANEVNSPIIVATSEGAVKYMGGYLNCVQMVQNLIQALGISVPVCLHLDHGTYEGCKKALAAGYSSVMYDGSKLDIKDNIAKSAEIVQLAKQYNASVEVEVGTIGGIEDGISATGELANLDDCISISQLDIDMLACGIGNVHGIYPNDWEGLNFDLLQAISKKTNLAIVLHGGSGIDSKQIQKSIQLGVCKINVNTECQIAFANAIQNHLVSNPDLVLTKLYDPRKILAYGTEAIKQVVKTKYQEFNCINRNIKK